VISINERSTETRKEQCYARKGLLEVTEVGQPLDLRDE